MLIIGCDYHPSVQQIVWGDTESGECGELRLKHIEAAEQFYRELKKGVSVRVGIEATGHSRWFERLVGELNYELCWRRTLQCEDLPRDHCQEIRPSAGTTEPHTTRRRVSVPGSYPAHARTPTRA